MRFKFNPCPDCGYVCDVPNIERTVYYDTDNAWIVRAYCPICYWETGSHRNVKECAEEWNSTKLYREDVEEDSDYLRKARRMAGDVMEELNNLDRTGEALYTFVRQLRYVSKMYAYRDAMKSEYDFEIVPADEYKRLKGEQ